MIRRIIGKHFSVFYPQEDLSNDKPREILARLRNLARPGRGLANSQGWFPLLGKRGLTALRDPKGNLLGFATHTGLTEKREEAEALTKANDSLSSVWHSVPLSLPE